MKNKKRYSSQEIANILGVYKKTLLNWEASGKIPQAKRDPMNNYRYYTEADVNILRNITKR